jgi:hypothetical protein
MEICASCGMEKRDTALVPTANCEVPICGKCFEQIQYCSICSTPIPPGFGFHEAGDDPRCENCEDLPWVQHIRTHLRVSFEGGREVLRESSELPCLSSEMTA